MPVAPRNDTQPDMDTRRPNPGRLTEAQVLDASNPTQATDAEVYQAEALGFLPVRVQGPVLTQQMPTVSAGSRTETIAAAARSHRIAAADPRRASVTIITSQPTYISSSRAQVELGTAALIPANIGVVISHRQEIFVGMPATNSFPATVAVLVENWAY